MESGPTDGRLLRSERSRRKMVDALFDLVGEGNLRPTAHQVAERAGVGIRTVFRQFKDMETLYIEMDEKFVAMARPALEQAPISADIEARALGLARDRCQAYERFAPYLRSVRLQRLSSPFLRSRYAHFVEAQRAVVLRWIPELAEADRALADALESALSFEHWEALRGERGLGRERTHSAIAATVSALAAQIDA